MPLFSRPDGIYLHDLPALRRFMPFLMPTRNESAVYFEQMIDASKALALLQTLNQQAQTKYTIFHVFLCAAVRTLAARPHLNRFVAGQRVYQRKHIDISFAVKKEFRDEASLSTVKIRFEPSDTIHTVSERVAFAASQGRGSNETASDKEVAFISRLPRFVVRLLMRLQRSLDAFNLLPRFMIEPDPMYASLFAANLGSVGLDAAFHHLYEYGTVPIFAAVGAVRKMPIALDDGTLAVRDVLTIRYTLDERIADGFYCARSLALLKDLMENPEKLV